MKVIYKDTTYDLLTKEELLNKKKRAEWVGEHLVSNLCNICLQEIGKDFIWAKEHDLEDLRLIDVVALTSEQRNKLEPIVIDIIKKQLGCSKRIAQKESGWYWFMIGLSTYYPEGTEPESKKIYLTEKEYKDFLKRSIKKYEDTHGELKYKDGWEKELKAFCEY